jgi:hypothetical protein
MDRKLKYGTVGGNFNVLARSSGPSAGVPNYIDDGFSMFASDAGQAKITTRVVGIKGQSTLTLYNNSGVQVTPLSLGIKNGMYITGVNIPATNDSFNPVTVTSVSVAGQPNQIIILGTLINNIDQGYANFYLNPFSVEYQLETMAASGVESLRTPLRWDAIESTQPTLVNGILSHTYSWTSPNENSKYNLDKFIYLASKNGIQVMPRLSSPPEWEIDYDYRYSTDPLKQYRDPTPNQSYTSGVITTGSGYSGSVTVTIPDLNRGFLIQKKMVVSGTGIQSGTIVNNIVQTSGSYVITLSKTLTANIGSYASPAQINNLTFGINNFETNNSGKNGTSANRFVFETIDDLNIFLINLKRKGGVIPTNYDNFVTFVNAALNRYGTNGTFWNDLTIWQEPYTLTRSAQWTLNAESKTTNVITVNDSANIVVGMTVEDATSQSNENNLTIPPGTRVSAIDGKNITLEFNQNKFIDKPYISSINVKFQYPKIINYQIYNEPNLESNESTIYFTIKKDSNGNTINKNSSHKFNFATNWPQHKRRATIVKFDSNGDIVSSTSGRLLLDKAYTWAPSLIELVEKIKLEAHSVDPNAKIFLGAMAEGTDSGYLDPIDENTDYIGNKYPYQAIFEPKFGNGKNKFDGFSGNTYRTGKGGDPFNGDGSNKFKSASWRVIYNVAKVLIKNVIESKYFTLTASNGYEVSPEIQFYPNFIISENGSPPPSQGMLSQLNQNDYVGPFVQNPNLLDTGTNKETKNYINLAGNSYTKNNIKIESIMYYKWTSNATLGETNYERLRGLIYYKTSKSDTNNTDIKSGTLTSSGNVLTFAGGSGITGVSQTTDFGVNVATFTKSNHGLINGMKINFSSITPSNAGLLTGFTYYVSNVTTDTFQLSSMSIEDLLGAGYGGQTGVTANAATNTFTKNDHGFANGNQVYISNPSSLSGLLTSKRYYIINSTTDTFQLSLTFGGSVVDITSNISSVNVMYDFGFLFYININNNVTNATITTIPSNWTVNSSIFANGSIPNFPSQGAVITAKNENTLTISVTPSSSINTTLNNANYVSCLFLEQYDTRQAAKIYQNGGSVSGSFSYPTGALDLEGRT